MSKTTKTAKEGDKNANVKVKQYVTKSFAELQQLLSEQTEKGILQRVESQKFIEFALAAKPEELMEGLILMQVEHLAISLYGSRVGELDEEMVKENPLFIRNRALHYLIHVLKSMIGKDYTSVDKFPEMTGDDLDGQVG